MKKRLVFRGLRGAATASVLALGLQGLGGLIAGPMATADSVMLAVEAVNIRTGPGTNYRILSVLPQGGRITATGPSRDGWTPVTFKGQSAWISTQWLSNGSSGSTQTSSSGGSSATTLEAVNIRSGPGLTYRVITVAAKGSSVSLTGRTQNGFAQLQNGNWVSSSWITTGSVASSSSTPAVVSQLRATAPLMIRTTNDASFTNLGDVPAGTLLDSTGTVVNGMAQIVYQGQVRWVNRTYALPAGVAGPVATSSASSTAANGLGGSATLSGLTSNARGIVSDVRSRFPQISTIYGVRADSLPDHPSGHAVDLMLPNYTSNRALGEQIANYYKANASAYGVEYIIFNQRIWSVARASEGWRYMADRGSDTANHVNHVHITVY